jgi:hypothetical protein
VSNRENSACSVRIVLRGSCVSAMLVNPTTSMKMTVMQSCCSAYRSSSSPESIDSSVLVAALETDARALALCGSASRHGLPLSISERLARRAASRSGPPVSS